MSQDSRCRMISFRLTAEEYDRFHDLCFEQGIRSVSEMARAAINMLLQQPTRALQESLEARVAELEGRLHMLSLDVRKLNQPNSSNRFSVPPQLAQTASIE